MILTTTGSIFQEMMKRKSIYDEETKEYKDIDNDFVA